VLAAALVPVLDNPVLFLPVHIVLLELIIHPIAMLAFQQAAAEQGLQRLPHEGPSHFFSRRTWLGVAGAGVLLACVLAAAFELSTHAGASVAHGRSLVIILLACWSACIAVALNRSRHGAGLSVPVVAAFGLAVIAHVPVLGGIVHLEPLHVLDWVVVVGTSAFAAALATFARQSLYAKVGSSAG
jgi:Ca2+-transporting ATPase